MTLKRNLVGLALGLSLVAMQGVTSVTGVARAATALPQLVLDHRIGVDAAERWDYAAYDSTLDRVFVTLGDHVSVVDARSEKIVGRIDGLSGTHGVAFAPKAGLGFISNGKSNLLTTFDLKTLAVLRTTPVEGDNPDAVLYDEGSGKVYTFNGKSRNVSAIDPATGKVTAHLAVPGKPEFVAANGKFIYLNIEDIHHLVVIDTATFTIVRDFDLPDCEEPTGLDFDAQHQRVFSVCGNGRLIVTAPQDGRIVATVAIGEGADAVVYDASRGMILSTNGHSGTVSVVEQTDADHYTLAQTVTTAPKARTLAYRSASAQLFIPLPGKTQFELLVVEPKK